MKYYWLLAYRDGRWEVEFGDYDLDVVREEAENIEGFMIWEAPDDTQDQVDVFVQGLNKP